MLAIHSPIWVYSMVSFTSSLHPRIQADLRKEGLNGRLPNQDLINAFERISRHTGGVPVVLYDHIHNIAVLPSWIPEIIRNNPTVQTFAKRARNVFRHLGYQATGRPSGIHGLLHP